MINMLKLLEKNAMLMRRHMGNGEYEGVKFEFGLIVPLGLYFEALGRVVVTENSSLGKKAVEMIKEAEGLT
jgi:hypothetical protein